MVTAELTDQQKRYYAQVERSQRKGGCPYFTELLLRDHATQRPVRNAQIHFEWHEAADNFKNVIIQAPRAHAKTEQMIIGRMIWELGMNPELRIKIISANDVEAAKRVRSIREHIESNPVVHDVFPHLVPKKGREWTDHTLTVERNSFSKDASIESKGIMSTATGGRADLEAFDDPVDDRNALLMPALREPIIETFDNVWRNLLEPEGRILYAGTPWHNADLLAHILKQPDFYKVTHRIDLEGLEYPPAIRTANSITRSGVLWPERWHRAALEERRRAGLRAFQRGYMLMPISDEEVMFGPTLVANARRPMQFPGVPKEDYQPSWPTFIGVDLASALTDDKGNNRRGHAPAYTVIFCVAIDERGRRIPIDIRRARQSFPVTITMIKQMYEQYHPSIIGVENNAFQQSVVQQLQADSPFIPVIGLTTGAHNKMDMDIGLPSMHVQFENGGWVVPQPNHIEGCTCALCAWTEELSSYPASAYSDTLMAMWVCEQAVRAGYNGNTTSEGISSYDTTSKWHGVMVAGGEQPRDW